MHSLKITARESDLQHKANSDRVHVAKMTVWRVLRDQLLFIIQFRASAGSQACLFSSNLCPWFVEQRDEPPHFSFANPLLR
jgi:hypothetical protein